MTLPRLSFVVPVRNDARRLDVCLRSIRAATARMSDVEIIVIDNGSTDGSPDVARSHGARVSVLEYAPVSALRNQGARLAKGDILAFIDADNELVRGWGDATLELFKRKDVDACGALYQPPRPGTWVQRAYGILRGVTTQTTDVSWLGSGNLAIRREAFEAVNGFNTTLEACEDVDLCHRLRERGRRIVGDPRLGSIHHGDPRTLRDLFKSELWRGRDNLRVSFRRPLMWSSMPSAFIALGGAAALATAIVGTAFSIAGWWPGAVIAATTLALFVLVAAARAIRSATRATPSGDATLGQVLVVVLVYDLARALALMMRMPHRASTVRTPATAS